MVISIRNSKSCIIRISSAILKYLARFTSLVFTYGFICLKVKANRNSTYLNCEQHTPSLNSTHSYNYQRMEPQCPILDILNFYLFIGKKLPISGNFLPLVSKVSQICPRVWQFYILSNSFNQNQNKIGCLKYNFKIFIPNYNAFGPNKKCA